MQVLSTKRSPRRAQAGASLLEVLIAVLVLAIGLLGIAALQAVTLRNIQGSADRTVAVIQSYTILDMMRANRDAALGSGYDTGGLLCEAPDVADRADADTAAWIDQMQDAMGPTACGSITCSATSCAVTVRWTDRSTNASGAPEQYSLVTETDL